MSRKIALVAKGRSTDKALERGVTASTDRSVALQFTLVREYLFTWWTWLAVGTVGSHHVLFQWMVVAKLFIAVATLVVWALKWRHIQHCRVCMVSTQKGLESTILTDLVQFNGLHYFDVMQCHSFFFYCQLRYCKKRKQATWRNSDYFLLNTYRTWFGCWIHGSVKQYVYH